MTALSWLNGIAVEDEWPGVWLADVPGVLNRVQTQQGFVDVPGLAGGIAVGPPIVPLREFQIAFWIDTVSPAAVRRVMREMVTVCGYGLIPVRIADRADIFIFARCIGARMRGDFPDMISLSGDCELLFQTEHPYWRDLSALPYHLDGTKRPLPGGNASTSYIVDMWGGPGGGTDPTFTLYDATGHPIRSTTLDIDFPDDSDWVRIVTNPETYAIYRSLDGVISQEDGLLSAGLFPMPLDPTAYGNPYTSAHLLASVTGATGQIRGQIMYPRMYA